MSDNNTTWDTAHDAVPSFYTKPDGTPFGSYSLTEDTVTILPKQPQKLFALQGKPITEWQLGLVSITEQSVLAMVDYFTALDRLAGNIIDEDGRFVLIDALSHQQLTELLGRIESKGS